MPSRKLGYALLLSLAATAAVAWIYTLRFNPEVRFWNLAFAKKREWAVSQRQTGQRLTVFSGGSTTSFQIDSDLLSREFGAQTVNAGFHAGMGLDGTVALATTLLNPGDRLVLMTEPSMLAGGGGSVTALAAQMLATSTEKDHAFFQQNLDHPSTFDFLIKCRPGLYHSATMFGKVLSHRPAYRYSINEVQPGGLVTTPIRITPSSGGISSNQLSTAGVNFLNELKHWAGQRNIEVIYLLPVSYASAANLERQRAANQRFAAEVAKIIPVWTDSYLGAWSEPSDFADTPLHMTSSAAKERTRDLGKLHFTGSAAQPQ